jgi:hypothetical protein
MSSDSETESSKTESSKVVLKEENNVLEEKNFNNIMLSINNKYVKFIEDLYEKYKYHDELAGQLESDIKTLKRNIEDNDTYLLYFLTSNYLFCLEPITDHNIDYFMYQKDKITKKSGKVVKNKITKVIGKILFKKILKESDTKFHNTIFSTIYDIFMSLTYKNENNSITFYDEYIHFVKEYLNEDKNYSKMLMVLDNSDTILSHEIINEINIEQEVNNDEKGKDNGKGKGKDKGKGKGKEKDKGKGNSSNPLSALSGMLGGDFMNNLESTNIAKLAKNISEKINTDDFPLLNDPTKLLSSLTGSGEDSNNNIQHLLKFVVGEVEDAFKTNNIDEKQLLGEAQNIMSQFQGMSGFDPMSLFKNIAGAAAGANGGTEGQMPDMKQFESIFSNMKK